MIKIKSPIVSLDERVSVDIIPSGLTLSKGKELFWVYSDYVGCVFEDGECTCCVEEYQPPDIAEKYDKIGFRDTEISVGTKIHLNFLNREEILYGIDLPKNLFKKIYDSSGNLKWER
jgi:hypothetical protein